MDRVVDVSCRVIRDLPGHASRQFFLDLLHFRPYSLDHIHRVGIWQDPDTHEHRLLAGEANFGVVIFRAQHDVRDVAQSDQISFVLADDEFLEVVCRVQICVGS